MSLLHLVTSLFDHSSPTAISPTAIPPTTGMKPGGKFSPGTSPAVGADAATSSSTSAPAGTITANDFLTLLVTELKNQDPTSNQDPNAYINQLVGVNSLQQLISINQELSSATTASGTSSGSATSSATGSTTGSVTASTPGPAPGPPTASLSETPLVALPSRSTQQALANPLAPILLDDMHRPPIVAAKLA